MVGRHISYEGCSADNWRYQKTKRFWMPDGSLCVRVARAKQKDLKTYEFSMVARHFSCEGRQADIWRY